MSCGEYRRLISGYLDETLSSRQREAVLEHFGVCPACAATLARYRQMGLLLRRLPASDPSVAVRTNVLGGPPWAIRPGLSRLLPAGEGAIAGVMAALLLALGLFLPGSTSRPVAQAEPPTIPPVAADTGVAGKTDAGASDVAWAGLAPPAGQDAAVLQQVRRTVVRPGFQPLLPAYLPKEARLYAVNFGRDHPGGPIDRLEVAFAAGGERIQLRQIGGSGAAAERQQLEAREGRPPPKRLTVAGREWLYVRLTGPERGGQPVGVLIGQRDGLIIRLESSLPVEEMVKVAASLRE